MKTKTKVSVIAQVKRKLHQSRSPSKSDTPLTDAVRANYYATSQDEDIVFDFARELERANAELRKENVRLIGDLGATAPI
jgi:hypothetical protein